jgi:pyruvate kinase
MTPTQHLIATQAQRLIPEVAELYERALKLEQEHNAELQRVAVGYRDSARNLLHYLAIRQVDVRQIQMALAAIGLSSLGRMEAHTLNTLHAVLFALSRIANQDWKPAVRPPVNLDTGQMLLARQAKALLGLPAGKRSVRIMVTMPTEAATNLTLMRDLLAAGMDVMRINCAHDGPEVWAAMADNLRRAQRELGRECKIQADLGGPKLRTGALQSAGRFLRIRPERDIGGAVVTPARVWLIPAETPQAAPAVVANPLQMPREFLQQSRPGDVLRFSDRRGKKRAARIISSDGESRLAEFAKTAYVEEGLAATLHRNEEQISAAQFSGLPSATEPLQLAVGDQLLLTRSDKPGRAAVRDFNGQVINPARIPCTLKEAFDAVKPGERVWFDDGKIGGMVTGNDGIVITVEITHTNLKGGRLRAEKGINLPDTELNIPALTDQDLADLESVVRFADIIGLSFVRAPEDVLSLQDHLTRLGAQHLGVVLKIETRRAFENLPQLLLASLASPPVGVMVARGDLGVEVGFERLAEVQEQILWLSEAAHVPVIWATQVLEGMAKKGAPSRAEVSDAAMSGRAECVMLNKGPYIVETVRFLNGILERMDAHQSKRRAMMRRLSISEID